MQTADTTDPPELLRQVAQFLPDPTVNYLLGTYFYNRDNYPRRRYYPGVFSLHPGEVANLAIGPDFLAFDTAVVRCPEDGEPQSRASGLTASGQRFPLSNAIDCSAK